MYALENILEKVQAIYSFDLPHQYQTEYADFCKRQKKKIAESRNDENGKQVELQAHLLFVFSLYMRHTGVLAAQHDLERTIIDSWPRLKLLKARGSDGVNWEDRRLYTLYRSTTIRKSHTREFSYTQIFDQVGSDPLVIQLWGKAIIYRRDISFMGEQKYVTRW